MPTTHKDQHILNNGWNCPKNNDEDLRNNGRSTGNSQET